MISGSSNVDLVTIERAFSGSSLNKLLFKAIELNKYDLYPENAVASTKATSEEGD